MRVHTDSLVSYVEYERGTLAKTVPGYVTHRDARLLLERTKPEGAVLITFYLAVHHFTTVVEPHPDCDAPHAEQVPEPFTNITCEAFPNVLPEHVKAVESFGIRNRVVRIPLVRPLEVTRA